MIPVIGALVAGLGLFFVGLSFLTEHLKMLSGRRLRERIAAWTKRPLMGVLWGGVFIAITQSTAATMFILVSMLRAGMVTVAQSLPMIIGVNVAAGLIVLILVFDIKIAILFLLGLSGIVYTSDKARGLRAAAGTIFGISLLFFGLNTMQAGVAPLAETDWFESALQWTKDSYLLGFAIGVGLSFLVQSSLAVVVLTIALQQSGLFSLNESIMIVYGGNVGSSVLSFVLSASMSGQSKQIAMYQTAYNFAGAIILVPLFYLEIYGAFPLVKFAAESITQSGAGQVAVVNMIFNLVPGVVLFVLLKPASRLLERLWPETFVEQASKPKYLHDRMAEDPDTALELVELEQCRLVEYLANALDTLRQGGGRTKLEAYQEAFTTLSGQIREAISDLSTSSKLSQDSFERLNNLMNIQQSLQSASEVLGDMQKEFAALEHSQIGARFVASAIEGLDTILLTLIDVAKERSTEDAQFLEMMTSEEGHGISNVRSAYLAEESNLDPDARMKLLAAANYCERLIWLFGSMGRHYMALKV